MALLTNDTDLRHKVRIMLGLEHFWTEVFIIIPRRCSYTNKLILPFSKAFRGERIIHGPGTPVFEILWTTPKQYMIQKLIGKL